MNKENYLEIYSHSLNKENVKYLKLIPKIYGAVALQNLCI